MTKAMVSTAVQAKQEVIKVPLPEKLYATFPWMCHHAKDHSEIRAYVEASGVWETVLHVHSTSGVCHEDMASFLVSLIQDHQGRQGILHRAMDALELVLQDGLTFTSEQAMEKAVSGLKQVLI